MGGVFHVGDQVQFNPDGGAALLINAQRNALRVGVQDANGVQLAAVLAGDKAQGVLNVGLQDGHAAEVVVVSGGVPLQHEGRVSPRLSRECAGRCPRTALLL